MFTIDTVAKAIETAIDKVSSPAQILPPFLLYCTAIKRPGISASKIAAEIITNNHGLGISTGVNPDGSPNMVNEYTYNVVKCVIDAIKTEGVIQVAIPKGSIMVEVNGANAGGPMVSIGTNINDSIGMGLIR